MPEVVHEVVCAHIPCGEKVGTSESFNALAFLLSDLGWTEVGDPVVNHRTSFYCPQHKPDIPAGTRYTAMCINCNFDWGGETFVEDEFPLLRSDHSRGCFIDSHWQCESRDVKFHPEGAFKVSAEKRAEWDRLAEEATAKEMYVAMLIERDQWRRTEDELMEQRSWIVRTILKIRNAIK